MTLRPTKNVTSTLSLIMCITLLPVTAWGGFLGNEPVTTPVYQEAQGPAKDTASVTGVARALEAAVKGQMEGLEISTECWTDAAFHSAEVYGGGVTIWDSKVQYLLPEEQILQLVRMLQEAGFAEMPDQFGGSPQPKPPDKAAVKVTCRVNFAAGGVRKQVVQLDRGEQSKELKQLAARILEICEGHSSEGVRAESLTQALEKIESNTLAIETLHILVNRKPNRRELEEGAPGWILRIDGRRATARTYHPQSAPSDEEEMQIKEADLRRLAQLMAESKIDSFPVNLYAQHYTDFSVQVLNHKKNIQARQFAGMTAETHGDKQKSFDRVFQFLDELRKSVGR